MAGSRADLQVPCADADAAYRFGEERAGHLYDTSGPYRLPARGLPAGQSLAVDYVDWTPGNSFPESEGWLELTTESEPPYL